MNTDAQFEGIRCCHRPPVLVEVIEATISIDVDNPNMYGQSTPKGCLPARCLCTAMAGCRLKSGYESMYYLIQAEQLSPA